MPSQKPSFDIYTDLDIPKNPEKSALPALGPSPIKRPRFELKVQPMITKWLKEPLREIAPNFARPTDPTWTMARQPDKVVSLGSLKKWQKKQPNDHTSKLFSILSILFYFFKILFYILTYL
jgi:hypothetical protein